MAWNGSDSGVGNSTQSARDAKNAKPGGGGQPRSSALTMKGLVALAIVVVGGGLAWWLLHGGDENREATPEKKRGKIAEATPAVVPRPAPAPVAKETPTKPKGVVTNFVNGVWHDEKGRPHYQPARIVRPGQKTIINGKPWRPEKPVFHHASEVELDVLLSRRPGERIYGEVNWQAFARDLPSALKDKIEILPDDSPDVVERKKAVMAAKEELAAAIAAGEDPAEILRASRDEVNRLADVRDNLMVRIAEMRQEGASEQEIEDTVSAANVMLDSYGIEQPIISPRTMRERGEAARARRLQQQQQKGR